MEVILVKHIKKLGKIGEIVKVKDGFGRNYLLPQKLAIRATTYNVKLLEQQREEFEEKNAKARTEAESIAQLVIGKELVFIKQAADDGKLFGSVNNKEIAKELSKLISHDIPYSTIVLGSPIKSLGISSVEVALHAEVSTNIIIVIARSDSEAIEALRSYKITKEPQDTQDL
ncbi:50S ribosomal protein L9 [Candidatus Trichorickettsia mobilis]|uniref:Large ribosomal subunit protein bL9 n=1 Tax=Candidatus Trichorickettsia mobilis TaxID=1346319 RepID=A0ABZ0UUM9_9RICK|nr:50S ribosomal protein L9 [Candidatus Trichorickettsia mobilis]WPY00337.1 50S ribosomal protein L9 [Candidatus Trichorickettsia mobilis]